MAGFTCQPDEAWDILVDVSQHSNVELCEVARSSRRARKGSRSPLAFRSTWRLLRRHGGGVSASD
ncbi:hypothetical protein [Streptomyces chartreusis]|uniref:hypothetical protein n=1 Tax=Streptomyces chartreusis TaxID=1969 RepID=UPI0036425EF6